MTFFIPPFPRNPKPKHTARTSAPETSWTRDILGSDKANGKRWAAPSYWLI